MNLCSAEDQRVRMWTAASHVDSGFACGQRLRMWTAVFVDRPQSRNRGSKGAIMPERCHTLPERGFVSLQAESTAACKRRAQLLVGIPFSSAQERSQRTTAGAAGR
eukprot:4687544-Pleurochrysis_carterae.AAC.3